MSTTLEDRVPIAAPAMEKDIPFAILAMVQENKKARICARHAMEKAIRPDDRVNA